VRPSRLALLAVVLATACRPQASPEPTPDEMVHTLTLPELPAPELPDAPGRAFFVAACSTCHTTRYVLDQPPFARPQWTAEVDKMQHTYGAPIPDEAVAPIIDYLVAVRGTEAPP
jgi:cytochrome c5